MINIFQKRNNFSLDDVEALLPLKTWYAAVAVLPVMRRLVLLLANYTSITPNSITFGSIVLRLFAAGCFLQSGYLWLVAGALGYYLAYLLDCADGSVARLTGTSSEFGRYLDHLSDLIGDVLILAALAFKQGLLFTPLVLGMLFMHVAEYYISFLTSQALAGRDDISIKPKRGLLDRLAAHRKPFFRRNLKSFFSFPDYEAWIFIVCPVLNRPDFGLRSGFYLLLIVVLYTVYSSFVTLHTSGRKFP